MRFSQSTHLLMFLFLDTLTSIIRTNLPILVELIDLVNSYNFSISNNLTQMVNFPSHNPDCDSYSPAFLDLFISSDASISSAMAFPPLGNSDHVVVAFTIDFLSNSEQDAPFHRIACDYSFVWNGLRDHLRVLKESITSQKFGSCDFWGIANSVLNKGKSAILPLFNGLEVSFSASDKAKLVAENVSKNFNLDDSSISVPVFSSRTNLKLHNISVTPKMVKKVIMNPDFSKGSCPDCIPVVVLKNCESELLKKCIKESCFPDCWKV